MKQVSIVLLVVLTLGVSLGSVSALETQWPTAQGTFIQMYLVANWTDEDWQREFEILKEVGMEYMILSPAVHSYEGTEWTIYPSNLPGTSLYPGYPDVIEACLRNAEKAGFKVFIGIYSDSDWWKNYGSAPEWLYDRVRFGNQVAQELWDNYAVRYPGTFYGWYWDWEVDNYNFGKSKAQHTLATAFNILIDYLDENEMRLPIMFSPFMNHRLGTPEHSRDMWTNVFAQTNFAPGDIFSPQDSVGAGGLNLEVLESYFAALREAVDTKPGLLFWSNAESFWQPDWSSALLDRFVKQMELVAPYVDNIVTFAYSHYYSPNNVIPGYHEAYGYYVENGVLPDENPQPSSSVQAEIVDDGVRLKWHEADQGNAVGYLVIRDGRPIHRILRGPTLNAQLTTYTDQAVRAGRTYEYEIRTIGFTGALSADGPHCKITFD